MESISNLDLKLFQWINSWHSPAFDLVMYYVSARNFWLPLYALLLFLAWRQYQKNIWKFILLLALLVLATDQTASGILKPLVQRLRPCHTEALLNTIHAPFGCGGLYGFCSSHAANTAGVAVFLVLLWRRKYPLIGLLLPWALLTGYSRIYLAAHYPGDVLVGFAIGAGFGWLLFRFGRKWLGA